MWRRVCALLLASATCAMAQRQTTAYEALKTLGRQMGRGVAGRIVSVRGVDGDPQPESWRIIVDDRARGGLREFEVAGGQVIAEHTPSVGSGTSSGVIKTAQLNLDSSGAFTVANYTADKSHTNFESVNYTLRNNHRGTPVWIVTLLDDARRPVGTIHIAANRGNVTRVEGMYHGANMAQVAQDAPAPRMREAPARRRSDARAAAEEEYAYGEEDDVEASDGDENVVKAEIKRLFRRTKRDARRLFQRVNRSFDDFFNRGG